MPTARLEGQRFRLGVWAVSDLTSTYEVRLFTEQSDQDPYATPWLIRGRESQPPIRARITKALDGTVIKDGFWQFQWAVSYWTFDMVYHWNTTKLGGAASPDCTVMTYDKHDNPMFLVCKTAELEFPRDGAYAVGGYRDIIIPFTEGVQIT